jgi:hypothetical protein
MALIYQWCGSENAWGLDWANGPGNFFLQVLQERTETGFQTTVAGFTNQEKTYPL